MKSIQLRAALTAAAISLLAPSLLLLAPATARAGAPGWRWPVSGAVITGYRNGDDPYAGGQHRGIDIGAPTGTPVIAATGGTVTYAGLAGSSGLTVAVRTGDGRFDTAYLHLSSIKVAKGDRVAPGDGIGAVGTTGRRSAVEPHLHFGVRDAGSRFAYQDPLDFLPVAPPVSDPPPRGLPAPVAVPAAPRSAPATVPATGIELPLATAIDTPLAAVAGPVVAAAGGQLGAAADGQLGASPAARAVQEPPADVRTGAAPASRPATPTVRAARTGRATTATAALAPPAVDRRSSSASGGDVTAPRPALGPVGGAAAAGPSFAALRSARTRLGPRLPHERARADSGLDVGWVAACLGLVAAAVALGRPARTARSLRRALDLTPAAIRSPGEQAR